MKFFGISSERFRFFTLILFFTAGFGLILWKLFQLQVVQSAELQERAANIRNSSVEIQARRGGIFVQDTKTGDRVPVALNTTLYNVFFDAREKISNQEDFPLVARELTEILYTKKRYELCQEKKEKCPEGSVQEVITENGDILVSKTPSYEDAKLYFEQGLIEKFSERRETLIYVTDQPEEVLKTVEASAIPHLYVSFENKSVWVDLVGLNDVNRKRIATFLAETFHDNTKQKKIDSISEKLFSQRRGYILVSDRVYPEEVKNIKAIKQEYYEKYEKEYEQYSQLPEAIKKQTAAPKSSFAGLGFEQDPLRYYPEDDLAAQVVGFVNAEGKAQYGLEKSLAHVLKGQDGFITSSRDVQGNTIDIDENASGAVIDGADVVLTLDRILQKKVESILDRTVEEYKADSAQAILVDPNTGEILVMANSPRFDPNFYGDVYARKKVEESDLENIYKTVPIERKNNEGDFEPEEFEDFELAKKRGAWDEFYIFENYFGPRIYTNKTIMEIYEPGSVFKPLVMASALYEGEIGPYDTYRETEPKEVDGFTIRNADGKYLGTQTMSNIIERSANLGMVYITGKMEKALTYEYLKDLGFGEYTNIKLPEELAGSMKHHSDWAYSHLYTAGYGQGISATPLQVVRAWTALSNGGYVVNPYIVEEIDYTDGRIEKTEIAKKRIFDQDTVDDMTQILINSTEKGGAKRGQVPGHYVAGKTGTSQIIKEDGTGYENIDSDEGDIDGTTKTSYVGFAPVDNPQYLLYVKYDRPRYGYKGLDVFGSTTAAPTFAEIMEEVFEYYDVPKDKF